MFCNIEGRIKKKCDKLSRHAYINLITYKIHLLKILLRIEKHHYVINKNILDSPVCIPP